MIKIIKDEIGLFLITYSFRFKIKNIDRSDVDRSNNNYVNMKHCIYWELYTLGKEFLK